MASKKMNPAPLAKATGLLDVSCWLASDTRVDTASLAHIQAAFVAKRTRLRPELARVVAALAFGGAA